MNPYHIKIFLPTRVFANRILLAFRLTSNQVECRVDNRIFEKKLVDQFGSNNIGGQERR